MLYGGKRKLKCCRYFHLFSVIMVVGHGICDLDLRKRMEILVKTLLSLVVVGMMKFLAKAQVKASKTIINNSFVFIILLFFLYH